MGDCTPDSIPNSVTIIYVTLYGFLMLFVSIHSFRELDTFNLKVWLKDIWKRKSCYIPLVHHIFDQVTDIAVAIQFKQLAERKAGQWDDCNGLNINYLFTLTVLSMVSYRLISSFSIGTYTASWTYATLQLLDLQIFKALHVNYICDKREPSEPQRWIQTLEAVFESSPQALIQLIFLIKTGSGATDNVLIVISLISSFWSIAAKFVADDKSIVQNEAKDSHGLKTIQHYFIATALVFVHGIPKCLRCCGDDFNEKLKMDIRYHYGYAVRVIWRIFDVTSNIFVMVFLWIGVGGLWLAIKVGFEVLFVAIMALFDGMGLIGNASHGFKHESQFNLFLTGLIATVIHINEDGNIQSKIAVFIVFRWLSNIAILTLICLFLTDVVDVSFGVAERNIIVHQPATFILFVYTWLSTIMSMLCLTALRFYGVFNDDGTSASRNLDNMIKENNHTAIFELQLFSNKHGVYDAKCRKSLLMLAAEVGNVSLMRYIAAKDDTYFLEYDGSGRNVFYYLLFGLSKEDATSSVKDLNRFLIHLKWEKALISSFVDSLFSLRSLNRLIWDKQMMTKLITNVKPLDDVLVILQTEYEPNLIINGEMELDGTAFEFRLKGVSPPQLYCFGSNIYGSLGFGIECSGYNIPTVNRQFYKDNYTQISSDFHSICSDEEGRVFGFGNSMGDAIRPGHRYHVYNPRLLTFPVECKAIQVAVGSVHSLILMDNGTVWSSGYNAEGQLGHGDLETVTGLKPALIESIKDIKMQHISCGSRHSCIIAANGDVYTFGHNETGQCGISIKGNEKVIAPTNISNIYNVSAVYSDCGGDRSGLNGHTVLLTEDGNVLSFGGNKCGQLGHDKVFGLIKKGKYHEPKVIESLINVNIIDISCGYNTTLCVSKNGDLYAFGNGEYGQLGHGDDTTNQYTPKMVEYFQKIDIKIAKCYSGSYHSAALSDNGDLYVFGSGSSGELGLGKNANMDIPMKLEYFRNKLIYSVSLGCAMSAVIAADRDNEEHKSELSDKYDVFVKNEKVFGYDEWVFIESVLSHSSGTVNQQQVTVINTAVNQDENIQC
eukprot:221420_1